MIQSRFATYYENHPESYDISKLNRTVLEKNESPASKPEPSSRMESAIAKKKRTDGYAYLEKSVEMKIELALMYIKRSHSHLQYI